MKLISPNNFTFYYLGSLRIMVRYENMLRTSIIIFVFLLFTVQNSGGQSKEIALKKYNIDWKTGNQTDFDLSFLLEKPAGAAGFIQIQDGHFYTADGKRLRIWGVNVTGGACFPEKEDAPQVAAFFARYGINGVRFHFMDSQWGADKSIIEYNDSTSRNFNPDQLDKFDFFVAELKKQGIYTNINLNVGRGFKAGDGVPETEYLGLAKAATLFNERMIQLQKEYARKLLTHVNPYTGNKYLDEPALILVEIVNENSLVEAWFTDRITGDTYSEKPSTWSGVPPYYAMELTKMYNNWLLENLSIEQIEEIAKEGGRNSDGLIPRLSSNQFKDASVLRFQTEASFLIDVERSFFTGMHHFLKSTLGLKAHVVGNSDHNHYKSGYALLSSLAQLDVVDGHVYWQHPNYVLDPKTGKSRITFNYTPMVNDPEISTVVQLSRSAVAGKPFTVSETNHPFPSKYACEGIPILAAYALLQDWDGIFYYTLEHGDPKEWQDKAPNPFDVYADPVKMTNLAMGALMFHRSDISKADSVIYRNYSYNEIIEGIRDNVGTMPYFTPDFNTVLPLIYGTRIEGFFKEHPSYQSFKTPDPIVSQTGELVWHNSKDQGRFFINTPRTQAAVGFVKKTINELPNLDVDINNDFSAIILSAVNSTSISDADELLLAVTSKFELSKMKYNENQTQLVNWGEKPSLIEPVVGKLTLKGLKNKKFIDVLAVGGDGKIFNKKTIKLDQSGEVTFQVGNDATTLYLIKVY